MTGDRWQIIIYFFMVSVLISLHIEQFSVSVCKFFVVDNIVQLLGHPKCDFNRIPIFHNVNKTKYSAQNVQYIC